MSKEYLEALERLYKCNDDDYTLGYQQHDYKLLQQALQRLESIDNANPSEALECLDKIIDYYNEPIYELGGGYYDNELIESCRDEVNTIKQALIKAQEQEKELKEFRVKYANNLIDKEFIKYLDEQEKEDSYIEKIKTMMKQKDCVLRYIESEDCFAVKTILSDGWYKLTPDFVDNNVREEIKPLPLIEKNKQLKMENAEYKRVLDVIKNKEVDVKLFFNALFREQQYKINPLEFYNGTVGYKRLWLTQKEFELLKRYFEKNIQK